MPSIRLSLKVKSMPTAAQIRAAVEKKLLEAGERRATAARRLRCPVHRKGPMIATSLTRQGNVNYQVTTCCEKLRKPVLDRLRRA